MTSVNVTVNVFFFIWNFFLYANFKFDCYTKGLCQTFLAVRKPCVKQSCWKFASRFVFGFRNFFSFLSTEIDRNFAFVAPADSKPKQKSFELVQQKICLQILHLIPLQQYWKSQKSWISNFGGLSASHLYSNHAENLQVDFFWDL